MQYLCELLWGTPMLVLLVSCGAYLTIKSGGFQLTHFGEMFRETLGSLVKKRKVPGKDRSDNGSVSPFSVLCTALAGTIGTGNIAGVAYAMVMGGAGAVFWMWIAAFFGMIIKFTESVLAVTYRIQTPNGLRGGTMYTLERGFAEKLRRPKTGKALALIFAAGMVAASFGMGNMSQITAMKGSVLAVVPLSDIAGNTVFCVAIMAALALVLLGGIAGIARFNERLVPFMAVVYITGSVIILVCHAEHILPAFIGIFKSAFTPSAALGGSGGAVIAHLAKSASWGFRRGIFSNEAGLGSSASVHALSAEKDPQKQGLWGMFEVFFDTVVICTLTALVLLVTGVVGIDPGIDPGLSTDQAGLSLASEAFSSVFGNFGGIFIAVSVMLFAFSSILGWSFYGICAWEYLFGTKAVWLYKVLFIFAVIPGMFLNAGGILRVSDLFNGVMAIPNLIAIIALTAVGGGREALRQYSRRRSSAPNFADCLRAKHYVL